MIAKPDPTTFQFLPWRPKDRPVARMFCDILNPDGTPYEGDPRYALKRTLKKAADLGYIFYAGPELEYLYFENNEAPKPIDKEGYFDTRPLDLGSDLRRDTIFSRCCCPADTACPQFGRGKYRIDGARSRGQFNNIFLTFQAKNSLSPAAVAGTSESTFAVKDQKVTWRSYKTVIEGRSFIRKEALLPNILPRQKQGNSSDYIAIRMDADSPAILDELTPVAEGILQDAVAVKAGP